MTRSASPKPSPVAGTPGPDVTPTTPTTPVAPAATGAPLVLLGKPSGESRLLDLTIAIDATYAVARGAGVIANNGAAAPIQMGGSVISDRGGAIISNNAGTLTSKVKLISDVGSGLTAKVKYHLAQAGAPAAGAILPAGGMVVMAVDMTTGRAVPVGVDPAGAPVYAATSDAGGRIALYLPREGTTNVRVLAFPPGSTDARMDYSVITASGATEAVVDEDTAQVSAYVRTAYTTRLLSRISIGRGEASEADYLARFPAALRPVVEAAHARVDAAFAEAGLAALPRAVRERRAAAIADAVLAHVNLANAVLNPDEAYTGPQMPAMAGLTLSMRAVRERTAAKMEALTAAGQDPTAFFAGLVYFRSANAGRAEPLQVRKPSDMNDFLVKAYLANDVLTEFQRNELIDLALFEAGVTLDEQQSALYRASLYGVITEIAKTLYFGDGAALDDEIRAALRPDEAP